MKLVRPSLQQAAVIVQSMYAVISAQGRIAPVPLEIESIEAAQRHLLGQSPPLTGAPGPLPATLASVVETPALRRLTMRILALLPLIDRRVMPQKVQVVREAAARLGVHEYGLIILERAAKRQHKRIALGLMRRFVALYWSQTGRAKLSDWMGFVWWMLPQLHGAKTARRNRELVDRYRALGELPAGTFGKALHEFFVGHGIPLPGEPQSVPWALHEVYHMLGEYGVRLSAELTLTGFIGGTQDETCLDQMMFGLLSYHCGRQIVGGFATEGVLRPDEFFRAVARGAQINVDMISGWTLWDVAAVPLTELRAKYNLPVFTDEERTALAARSDLLTGPGFSVAASA
jgi:hypothetical protein